MPVAAPSPPTRPAPAQPPRKLAVRRDWLLATTALLPIAAGPVMAQPAPRTGPTGGQVVAGQAGIVTTPGRTTITQGTDRAAINWQQFNVGSQHTVQFVQPSQGSWTLNRVVGPDPSVIAGRVQANGGVAIVNQSGMVFAGGAQVNVGSLIASAAGITNENFMAGRMAFDQAARPGARVENRGSITVADRGLAALVGPGVSNSGVIRARLGRVALGAAETFVLDLAGDGLIGIDVTQAVRTAPAGGDALVTNSGVIEAAGGSVLITAHAASGLVEDLVRQTGRIEAPTVGTRTGEVAIRAEGGGVRVDGRVAATGGAGERGGRIALQATGTVTAGATARIDASGGAGGGQVLVGTTGRGRNQTMARRTIVERGAEIRADATGAGHGGMLVLNSLERTEMRGALSARGGAAGGNGGFVELSGQTVIEAAGTVDVRAPAGANGELLLDPQNIIVSNTALPAEPAGLPGGDSITVEITTATGSVTANTPDNDEWTRVSTAAITGFAGTVTLDAARDIIVDSAIDKTNGGLTLLAGRNVTLGAAVSVSGDFIASAGTGAIAVNAAVAAGSGQTITLRADTVTFSAAGSLAAVGGVVEIGPQTAGRNLRVGSSVANTLVLAAANLGAATITADTLRLGETTITGLGTVTAGNVTVATGAGFSRPAGAGLDIVAGGDLTIDGGLIANAMRLAAGTGTLDIGANLRASVLTLSAGTAIDQTGGNIQARAGAGTALPISAIAGNGAVSLDNANNGSFALGASSATAGFTVAADTIATTGLVSGTTVSLTADTGALTIGGDIRATSLTLAGAAGIDQTAGTIQHSTDAATQLALTANATGGNVSLAQDGNGNLALGASAASGTFTVAADTLATTGAVSGTTVSLVADTGVLTIGGDIRATGLALAGATGIDQTGGNIRHSSGATTELAVTANAPGGDIDLARAGNGTFALGEGTAGGTFTVAADTLRTTGAIEGTTVSLTADTGALTIGADIRATSLALTGEAGITQSGGTIAHVTSGTELALTATAPDGAILLDRAGNGVFALGASAADAGFTVAAEALRVTGTVSGTDVSLTARTGALGLEGDIRATGLTLAAATGITQAAGTTIRHAAGATTVLDLSASVSGTGEVALTQGNGALNLLSGGTADGNFALTSAEGLVLAAGEVLSVAGAVTLTVEGANNALTLDGAIHAQSVALAAAGDIAQDAAGVLAFRNATTGAADLVTALALTVDVAGSNDGIVLAGDNGRLRVTGATTTDGDIAIRGRHIEIAGTVTATGGGVTLTAFNDAGTGTLAMGATAAITAQTLALNAARGITQDSAATITLDGGAGRLTVRGGAAGNSRAGSISLAGINDIGELDIRATATPAGAFTGVIDVTVAGPVSIVQANGATVTVTAGDLTVAAGRSGVTATGDVRLVADSLGIAAGVTAGTGGTLTLRTDTLAVTAGGSLSVADGTLEIGPRTAGRAVAIDGTANPAALHIAAAALEGATADTIRIGTTTIDAASVTAGSVTFTDALSLGSGVVLEAAGSGAIAVNAALGAGSVRLDAGTAITLGAVDVTASGTGGGIALRAGTSITQTAGGALVASGGTRDLVAHAGAGDITLAGEGSFRLADGGTPAGAAGPRSLYAAGSVSFATDGALTVAATAEAAAAGATLSLQGASVLIQAPLVTPGDTGTVALTATGAGQTISQTAAGTITANLLTATADGAILLDQAPNAVASLGAIAFETAFGYRNAGGFTVGTAIGPTGGGNADITLVADTGDLTLNAPIGAGTGTVALEATIGAIGQAATGAGITAGRLEVAAGTDALLAPTGGNAVAVLGASTVGGTLSLATTGALALDGTIVQSGAGGTLSVTSGGALTVNAGAVLGFDAITLATPGAMTLRGTVGVTGGAATSTVRLGAGGDITQEAGGIVAALLGLRSGGAVDLTAGANDVRAVAGFAVGTFALATSGALTTTTLAGLPTGTGGTADTAGVVGGSVSLTADALTVEPTVIAPSGQGIWATAANGVVRLRADQITIAGAIVAGDPGGSPSFNGTIDIAPRTAARAVQVGGGVALDALGLSTIELQSLIARNIVIGHDAVGAGTLTVTSPAAVLDGVNAVTLHGGAIALDSTFTLLTVNGLLTLHATSGDIVQGVLGGVAASRLAAIADAGSVLMGSPGALNNVTQVSGAVAANEDFTFRNNGSFAVGAPGIAAAGADVDLSSAAGGITQTTGARIAADRLRVAAPGDVVLDGGASLVAGDLNAVATLAPSSGANLTLRNATALTVEGATATGLFAGTVTLEAAGLTLAGDITANQPLGRVILRTGAAFDAPGTGSIDQTAGIIRAQGLSASAGGDVMLGEANEVQRLLAGISLGGGLAANSVVTAPGGTFLMANSLADLQVGARVNAGTGGVIGILADGLSVAPGLLGTVFLAPGGVVQFAPFTAGGTIGLGGAGGFGDTTTISAAAIERVQTGRLIIGALEPTDQVSSGTITLRGAVDLTGAGAPQALELRSGGDILADGFALSVPQISAYASGSIRLGTTDSRIGGIVAGDWDGVSGIRAGGPVVSVTSAGVDAGTGLFTVAAPIALVGAGIGGTITLQAPDFALLPGATIDTGAGAPGRIEIWSPGTLSLGGTVADAGTARLTSTELALLDANGGSILAAAPDIRLRGAWTIAPGTATRLELALTPGGIGAIRQIAGGLSVGTLAVSALQGDGVVQIAQAGNSLPVVGVEALGNISVATEGALEIRRTASSGGSVTYRGTDITLSTTGLGAGQVTIDATGRTVNLTATAGDITGMATQAAVRAATLNATAAAGQVLLSGSNSVGTVAVQARDRVSFQGTGATTVGAVGAGGAGTEVAGIIDFWAPSLTLNDVLGSSAVQLAAFSGNLLQNSGARLSAATLTASAAGTLRLAGTNGDGTARNTIQDLTALTAGGDMTLRNALGLTIDLPISVGNDRVLTLEANNLTIAGSLSAAGPNGQIILRTGNFNGGTASGGDITQTGGTISAATLAALAGGSVTIDLAGNAIGALGGGVSANGTALGLGLSAGTDATLRSNGFAGNVTLGVTGAVQVGTGRALTLRADDLAIAAQLRAPGGVITLLPATINARDGYVLGGAAGSTTDRRITLDSTELGLLPAGAAAELRLGALGVTRSVDIVGTVDLVDGATPRVGRLTLAGDGALTQAAGTLLDVATLSANFPNGAVLLDPGVAGNRIQALAGITAGGDVEIRGGAGLMELRDGGGGSAISAPTGATIVLRADDLDIQAAILATNGIVHILPETLGRSVTLGGPNAAAGTLALGTAELARIRGVGDAPVSRLVIGADGAPGATGTVRAAGDIVVAGDVTLRSGGVERVATLELVAGTPGTAGGSVRQTGGAVDVATITGTAQGDFQLGRAANQFDTATAIAAGTLPAAGATGQVVLATAGDLDANAITAPVSVRVAAGGALSAGGITAPVIELDGGTVTLVGLVQGSTSVAIDSAGGVSQEAGALIVTGLFTLNGGSISLPEDNRIVELGGLVATGPVLALNTVLPVLVSGAVSAVGSLSLTTDQGLTVANTGSITVTGGPGSVSLEAGGAIDYAGILGASGAANLMAGGALGFSGTATIGTFAGFEARGAMTLGGTISAGGTMVAIAGGALTLGGTITAGGDFTGTAGGDLGSTARLTATGDVTLSADAVLTAGGRIETLGGDLALTGATGLAANGTFIAGGSARLTATTGPLTLAGSLTAGVSLDVTGGGSVGTTAQVTTLGDANFTAAGALTAGGRIESTGGAVLMTATGALSSTGTLVADGNATLRSTAGALTLAGSLTAGGDATITGRTGLSATGSIDATGNALLSATAPAAALTLGGTLVAGGTATVTAGGAIGTTAQVTAAGDIGVTAGGTLTAGGRIESTGGALSMLGAALSVNATLVADGAATLRATSGTVGLAGILAAGGNAVVEAATGLAADGTFGAGGTLRFTTTAGPLTLAGTVAAGGTATVATGGALVTTAQVTAGGDATFTAGGTLAASGRIESTGGDLALTGATGLTSDAALVADGAATLRATGGTVGLTGSLTAGGNATVEAATGLAANGTFDAGGALRFATTTGGLVLGGTVTADGTASVTAGGAMTTTAQVTAAGDTTFTASGTLAASGRIQSTGADLALSGAGGLTSDATLLAGGAATLRASGGAIGLTGTVVANGAVAIEAAGTLSSTGTVRAGTTLGLTAGGTITLAGTHVAGTALAATAGGGIGATGLVQAGTTATLTALGGDLVHGGAISAGGDVRLAAGAALANTGGISAGGALALAAGGALSQTGTVGAGGAAVLTAGGSVLLSGQTTAATDLDISAGGTATLTGGKITAGNAVRLTAGQGVTVQSFQIDPSTILLQTGGTMALTDSTLVSRDSIRLAAGAITLRRTNFNTGTLDVDSTGNLLLDGGQYTIGRAVAFSAPSGIQTTGRIFVSPRGTDLPAVIFDTRAGSITPDPLSVVEPDIPGLPSRQQPTQVRVPGTEAPGDFGAASGAPAGTMVLNIDAGRSAIFLLLDGGTATGEIASAGRLAIHGTGGSAELTGRLTDVSGTPVDGAAAARFADSTRPAASGALTRYRLNGCVVSSVNCIVPSQIITIPQAPPQQVDLRLGNNRITDPEVQVPNVGDEDY